MKFVRGRRRWQSWLFEAKKRFGLKILNYVVTSNHIHLLAVDDAPNVIPKSLQLIAGRTAQEYDYRKKNERERSGKTAIMLPQLSKMNT